MSRLKFPVLLTIIISSFLAPLNSKVAANENRISGANTPLQANFLIAEAKNDQSKITWLEETGQIEDRLDKMGGKYFIKITSLCSDADNNLYVADSGQHKIFKLNEEGRLIAVFGSKGQGPGEFSGILRISQGNDGNLYVTDDGNWRLSIFSNSGEFSRQFPITRFVRDEALANSKGEIYLLSPSGLKLIDCYDPNMKLKCSVLDIDKLLIFPYWRPQKSRLIAMEQQPSINEVRKLITRDNHLIVVLNTDQAVIRFNDNLKIINEFKVDISIFANDYKQRLREASMEGGWINPFGSVFFDHHGNICFCYFNRSLGIPEIYRYTIGGLFIDVLRARGVKEETNRFLVLCSRSGIFYSIDLDGITISTYKEAL